MTLIESVEVLMLKLKNTNPDLNQNLRDALIIAISALQRIDRLRRMEHHVATALLDCETLE